MSTETLPDPNASQRCHTLYFFGAGASTAAVPTTPTTATINRLVREGLRQRDPRFELLRQFLAQWQSNDFEDVPTLEETLAVIDTCLARSEPIGSRWSLAQLAECRESLLASLYRLIEEPSAPARANSFDNGLYQRLLATLPDEAVGLISLNYDLLLDRALCAAGRTPDYHVEFQNGPAGPLVCGPESSGPAMPLYKLHGSLNWRYCLSCSSNVLRDPDAPRDECCAICGGHFRTLLVPPTPFKATPTPFLATLWKQAEWALMRAKAIVFIGYSLSDADAAVRALLFRAFYGISPEITVVLDQEDPVVIGRYRRLFPGGVRFYLEGFEPFVDAGGLGAVAR